MGHRIINPKNSFIQFDSSDIISACGVKDASMCLPILNYDDIAFQWIIEADTEEEADMLCDLEDDLLNTGLVYSCDDPDFAVTYTGDFKPYRQRLNALQVLYYWPHGFPDFGTVVSDTQCFRFKIVTTLDLVDYNWCTNCFQRITDGCFTSVLDYTGEDNQFGFNYCGGTPVGNEDICEPLIVQFINETSVTIPYTAQLQSKFGDVPTVKVWIQGDDGLLVEAGLEIKLDAVPPTVILINLGGLATGIVKIS